MNRTNNTKNPEKETREQLLEKIKLLKTKITELKEAETRQKEKDEQIGFLSTVVEQSFDGIAIASLENKLLYVNDSWANMHGYNNAKELIGKHLNIFHNIYL